MQNSDGEGRYPKTRWSLILAARGDGDVAAKALNELFRIYWYPIYASFRDLSHNSHDAEDRTQGFIESLLTRNDLEKISPEKGRFRSFLRASIKNFVANDLRHRSAQKRGGGILTISIDSELAKGRYDSEPRENQDPSTLFDRRWISTILCEAKTDLRREYTAGGRVEEFQLLEEFIVPNARVIPYDDVARKIGRSPGSIRVAAFRLRKRYRELIEDHIFSTVSGAKEAELEMGYLAGLVGLNLEAE